MKLFGSLTELVSTVFRKDSQTITLRPSQTTTYTAARDVQLPPQDAAAVLVSATSTQTLTNKTIDGDDNTVQDLALASLKTVGGSANNVVRRDNTGAVVSSGPVQVSDAGAISGAVQLTVDNIDINGNAITSTDTNGNISVTPNGTGKVLLGKATEVTGSVKSDTSLILEETGAGTDTITVQAPASIAASYTLTLPTDDGSSGQFLKTDGSGVTSWDTPSGAADAMYLLTNATITASVASNELTVSLKTKAGTDPSGADTVNVAFRNTSLPNGTYSVISATAATSCTVQSGSTLGQVSGQAAYVYVYAVNNAGTVEVGVSSTALDTTKLYSTGSLGSTASSYTSLYTATALGGVAIRYLGKVRTTQTTAGVWAASPTEISSGPTTSPSTFAYLGQYNTAAASGFGSVANNVCHAYRMGPLLKVIGGFEAGATNVGSLAFVVLPFDLQVDTARLATSNDSLLGIWSHHTSSSQAALSGNSGVMFWDQPTGVTTNISMSQNVAGSQNGRYLAQSPAFFANNDRATFEFTVPIAGWE